MRVAFWAAIAATIAPLLATRYLPFTDLPEHVALMGTLSRWFDASGAEHAAYDMTFMRGQYLLYHSTGALLTRVVGDAVLANRLLLVGVAVAWPLSVRSALRAFDRDEGIAILACMPFLSRPLLVGFLPYVASLPLYVFGLALVVRRANGALPGRRGTLALATLAVALLYTHLSAFLLFVATAGALEIVLGARASADPEDGAPVSLLRWSIARLRRLVWLAPAGAVAAAWAIVGRITLRGESLTDRGEIGKMDLGRSIHALPLWTFDIFRSHLDEICGGIWWTLLATLAVLAARASMPREDIPPVETPSRRPLLLRLLGRLDPAYVPLLCVLAIYFATPFRIGAGGMLNVRLAPLIAISAVLTVGRSRSVWRVVALGAVALTTIAHGANAVREVRALAAEHDMIAFDEILGAMRPGKKLVTLAFDRRRTQTHFDPYPFAGSYYRGAGGLVASYSFSDLEHWPMHYRGETGPPGKPIPLWIYHPCSYRNAIDGPYYDYVLVSGAMDPFAGSPSGPAFREIRRIPNFVLYEKEVGVQWTSEDPGGPCKP